MSDRVLDLVDRLRGIYTVAVNDGAGPLLGKDTFTRVNDGFIPPIQKEAADEIERLRAQIADLERQLASTRAAAVASTSPWQPLDTAPRPDGSGYGPRFIISDGESVASARIFANRFATTLIFSREKASHAIVSHFSVDAPAASLWRWRPLDDVLVGLDEALRQ